MSFSIEKNLIDQKNCPICSGDGFLVDRGKTINPSSDRIIDLLGCLACKHWWHNPLPNQELLNNFYQSSSEYVVPATYAVAMSAKPANNITDPLFEKIFSQLSSYSDKISNTAKSFNYLELGMGAGHMFNFFAQKANISYGVEPGEWAPSASKNIVSSIDKVPADTKFDLIVASDVLEHLSNPTSMLDELGALANDGCLIYCTFPNKDSLKAQIQKSKWHMVRPFGHLHYFSARSLEKMFNKSGWHIAQMKNCRIADNSAFDLIRQFDTSEKNILYRLIKSLLLGQILLGKDQWTVIALRNHNL